MNKKETSWGKVAEWYDELLEESSDSFQAKVILPNLTRVLDVQKGMKMLDIACGQGFFSRVMAQQGAEVVGCDISGDLIAIARTKPAVAGQTPIVYHNAEADKLVFVKEPATFDGAIIVLALQNIENLAGTLSECSRALKPGGRLVVVLNHPAFRIPKQSSWEWDEKTAKQYRRIDSYLSDDRVKIDMAPGEKDPKKKAMTVSFHRPLQGYFKALTKAGFSVARLEEWISHRKSQAGPRSEEEDRTRKEIPMFLMLEAVKGSK